LPTRTATASAILEGVRRRLPYLRDLGVDALWFNPWYPSPLADTGYDISDYRSIDPAFGTLEEAEQLIAEARALGIRSIVDIVPADHVVNAILAVCATTPEPGNPGYYHVSSGARNPLTFNHVYELIREYFDAHPFEATERGSLSRRSGRSSRADPC